MKFSELPKTDENGLALKIDNAIIESVSLSIEDHGILSGWLYIRFSSGGWGFGGYALGKVDGGNLAAKGNYAAEFIVRCLAVGGVGKWENLMGRPLRCLHEKLSGDTVAIGHFMKDDWFCPSLEFEKK